MPKFPAEQSGERIVISTDTIIDGRYFRRGEALPFSRVEDLPPALKPLVVTGEEEAPFSPSERDIYSPSLAREARRIRGDIQWQSLAEEHASEPLAPDVQELLEAEHAKRIALAKAQGEYAANLTEASYAAAAAETETKQTEYFVRRGGEWAAVARARLKPGEPTFVRRPNGSMEASGFVNSEGMPPDSELYL